MRAERVLPAGEWQVGSEIDHVLIEHDHRHRRRLLLHTEAGRELLLDLPRAVRLKEGDGLAVEDGVVRVCAKPERLMEISAESAAALVRVAWHLGNRHLPVQLLGTSIRIHADHVIADMVEQLGGQVTPVEAPFDPEAGAYAGGGHHHHHDHDTEDG